MASNKHVDLEKTKIFVRAKCDLEVISKDKGKKADIRESCKNFKMVDRHLTYKGKRRVAMIMIEENHNTWHAWRKLRDLGDHREHESTYLELAERFYWYSMDEDIQEYIKNCKNCQQQGKCFKKISPELQGISIPSEVIK